MKMHTFSKTVKFKIYIMNLFEYQYNLVDLGGATANQLRKFIPKSIMHIYDCENLFADIHLKKIRHAI